MVKNLGLAFGGIVRAIVGAALTLMAAVAFNLDPNPPFKLGDELWWGLLIVLAVTWLGREQFILWLATIATVAIAAGLYTGYFGDVGALIPHYQGVRAEYLRGFGGLVLYGVIADALHFARKFLANQFTRHALPRTLAFGLGIAIIVAGLLYRYAGWFH